MAGDGGRVAGHEWVAAAEVRVPDAAVGRAVRHGKLVVRADTAISVVDVYCSRCRRSWSEDRSGDAVCVLGAQHVGGPRHREDESIPQPRAAKPPVTMGGRPRQRMTG